MNAIARRSTVVGTAAVTGLALARLAAAQAHPEPPSTASPAPNVVAAPAAPAGKAAADEPELDHSHGPPGASSADGPAGAAPGAIKATIVRVAVPTKDGMQRVPGGKLVLYTTGAKNAPPPAPITIAPFWIDRMEVSVGDYRACVARGACAKPARPSATCTYDLGDPQLPVSCVHWHDADTYCRAVGKRLPSEAEWEFAARGNIGTPYPWGGGAISCKFAVTLLNERTGQSCAVGHPDRVGARPGGASLYGVLDLSGNVEEWTADWYVENAGRGPSPRVGSSHVLRGGGWLSPPSMSKTTTRNWGSAVEAGPNVGFRCAKDDV